MSELGNRLRYIREQHEYSQEYVARYLDMATSSYRRYETESVKPKTEVLEKLSVLYHMSTDELLGIGTVMTFEYAREDIRHLREVMDSDMPPVTKAKAIDEALKPLQAQRDAAFAPPNLTLEQMEAYADSTIRTVRYDEADEQLVRDAANLKYDLLLRRYEIMRRRPMYDINTLTEDDVRAMLAGGDDSHDNQIRVTEGGQVYLSQDVVGADDIGGLRFRFETFDAGNDYVGKNAAADDVLVGRIYRTLKANWPKPKYGTYVDVWEA